MRERGEHAYVEVSLKSLPLGGTEFDFTWVGPEHASVLIDRLTIARIKGGGPLREEFPTTLDLRGIPLRLIPGSEQEIVAFVRDAALYVRADGANALVWVWRSALLRARRPLRWVYVRLILTLYVWGLADWRKEEVITWRCVRSRLQRAKLCKSLSRIAGRRSTK